MIDLKKFIKETQKKLKENYKIDPALLSNINNEITLLDSASSVIAGMIAREKEKTSSVLQEEKFENNLYLLKTPKRPFDELKTLFLSKGFKMPTKKIFMSFIKKHEDEIRKNRIVLLSQEKNQFNNFVFPTAFAKKRVLSIELGQVNIKAKNSGFRVLIMK